MSEFAVDDAFQLDKLALSVHYVRVYLLKKICLALYVHYVRARVYLFFIYLFSVIYALCSFADGMLSRRARPPPAQDFVDIFQKFKLSFNLLVSRKRLL